MVYRLIRLLAACPMWYIILFIHGYGVGIVGGHAKVEGSKGGLKILYTYLYGSCKAMIIRVKVNYFRLLAWSNERIFFGEGQFQNWRMNVHTHPISKRQNSWYIDFLSTRMKSSAIFYKWRRHWFLLILRKLCLLCCAKISQ